MMCVYIIYIYIYMYIYTLYICLSRTPPRRNRATFGETTFQGQVVP